MKNLGNNKIYQFRYIGYLVLMFSMISGGIAFAAGDTGLKKGDVTTDGLTVVQCANATETQIKKGVDWSKYTKYEIAPVEVSFRANWKSDYNRYERDLTHQVTDSDMTRIRERIGKIVREEFERALKKKGGLTNVDKADSNTLLFKPRVINLDVYAPDLQNSSVISRSYVRQAFKATLFLEVYDAVSGEILGRWVDTRMDPDRGYYEWANRVTNDNRARLVIRTWVRRLVEGLDKLKAAK